jgi:hypothetical protein
MRVDVRRRRRFVNWKDAPGPPIIRPSGLDPIGKAENPVNGRTGPPDGRLFRYVGYDQGGIIKRKTNEVRTHCLVFFFFDSDVAT